GLLRARDKRPYDGRSAYKRNEVAPPHRCSSPWAEDYTLPDYRLRTHFVHHGRKANMDQSGCDGRFVPKADIASSANVPTLHSTPQPRELPGDCRFQQKLARGSRNRAPSDLTLSPIIASSPGQRGV